MTAAGSLVFCNDCGNLLGGSGGQMEGSRLSCDVCGAICQNSSSSRVITKSKPSAFPSALRAKRSMVETIDPAELRTEATIQETCPDCGRKEMRYTTLQLRSADEGSTIFFTCECGHKHSQNN